MELARTKIVATVGPASRTPERLRALMEAGVDVFRLNMSHGDHAEHTENVRNIRTVSAQLCRPVAVLCDLSGPKIRLGMISPEPVLLRQGEPITITTEPVTGTAARVSVNWKDLPRDVRPGQRILLDDGLLELRVDTVKEADVLCTVVRGGPLSSKKGLNLPNTPISIPALTEKDRRDMEFGLHHDADFFAVSFVKYANDITEARDYMKSLGGDLPLIAKIEKHEAVENLDGILAAADGAMVARGDLGVEIPMENVPLVQKRVIACCNKLGKPVITATQMLDSMIRSPRPTRAEVTDVANAIFDGTDAVMLSGETAVGAYPVESVTMMDRIAVKAEDSIDYAGLLRQKVHMGDNSVPDAISHAVAHVAGALNLRHILCLTQRGSTARLIARYRPKSEVLAYSPWKRTAQQLCLSWGVWPLSPDFTAESDKLKPAGLDAEFGDAINTFLQRGVLAAGDKVAAVAGLSLNDPDNTNMLRVLTVE